jgi:tetraacyldisaccharide 4'-kinase
VLTRGFGGREKGPVFVNSNLHQSVDVGDEPLMMSNSNTVCVSRNRPAGAAFISSDKELDCVVMDDGLQNPTLEKNLKIAVFDGKFGIGNGLLLPAGPMRETLDDGLKNVDMVIFNGEDETGNTKNTVTYSHIYRRASPR